MTIRGEVLIAIINNPLDFNIAHDRGWYRIPIRSAEKWLRDCWPPQWLAFYQTKIFGEQAYSINYYAQIAGIREVYRWELFPDEPRDDKSEQRYYQLFFDRLNHLSIPISSRRRRRIIFIPTTWEKFANANELNDLYDESPLEDLLWVQLKRWQIQAERQELVTIKKQNYFLDFAVYCATGNLDIETDGDTWHANSEKASQDNLRDNDIETAGWRLLRFNTPQIREQMAEYCVPKIADTINSLGGVDEGKLMPRKIDVNAPDSSRQLGLFDDL
jgi:very-short-patch-repair endonuclease